MADVDYENPEEVLPVLRKAYYQLLSGSKVARIRFADREVTYAATDISTLETVISALEAEVAKANGSKPTRFAMRLGSFRRYGQ